MDEAMSVHLTSFSHTLFQSYNLLNCFFNVPPTKIKVKAGGIRQVYQRRKDQGEMSTAEDFCHRPGEARGPVGSSAPSDSSELKKHFKVRDIKFFFNEHSKEDGYLHEKLVPRFVTWETVWRQKSHKMKVVGRTGREQSEGPRWGFGQVHCNMPRAQPRKAPSRWVWIVKSIWADIQISLEGLVGWYFECYGNLLSHQKSMCKGDVRKGLETSQEGFQHA